MSLTEVHDSGLILRLSCNSAEPQKRATGKGSSLTIYWDGELLRRTGMCMSGLNDVTLQPGKLKIGASSIVAMNDTACPITVR